MCQPPSLDVAILDKLADDQAQIYPPELVIRNEK